MLPHEAGEVGEGISAREFRGEWGRPDDPVPQDSLNVRRVGRGLFEPLGEVEITDGKIYVGSYRDVVVYDLENPVEPVEDSYFTIPEANIKDIDVEGNYVYVTTFDKGLWVVESGDGYQVRGHYDTDSRMLDSFVSDGTVYIDTFGDSLEIVDVSDPESPRLLMRYGCGESGGTGRGIREEGHVLRTVRGFIEGIGCE